MVVATAGVLEPVRRFAARIRLLPHAKRVAHGDRVRLHVGADQVVGRVHVLDGKSVQPGSVRVVEVETFGDVCTAPGDRIVMRTENASATLGGGIVVQVLAKRLPRRRQGLIESLEQRSRLLADLNETPRVLIRAHLESAGVEGTNAAEVAARTGLVPKRLSGWVDEEVEAGTAVRLGHDKQLWMSKDAFDKVRERVEAGAKRMHDKDPALTNLSVSAVRTAAGRLPTSVLDAALANLLASGRLVREGPDGVRLASHAASLSAADQADLAKVSASLAAGAGQPPAVEDLEGDLALTRPRVLRALKLLVDQGRAFRAGDYYFDGAWLAEGKAKLTAHAEEHGGFTPGDARGLLVTTRKWVIPLLEALDKSGFSRRVGDKRVLRR